jgi:hypothetical protein
MLLGYRQGASHSAHVDTFAQEGLLAYQLEPLELIPVQVLGHGRQGLHT